MPTLELTIAYMGLILVMITWGADKTEWLEKNKNMKKIVGIVYMAIGIISATIYYLYAR